MSIPFSGCRSGHGGLIGAIAKQVRLIKLQPLKKVTVQFDPFHKKVTETRNFLTYLSSPKILVTNPSCYLKTEIVCDRSDPIIICNFENQEKLIFKPLDLTALELLTIFNKYVSDRVPPEKQEIEFFKKGTKNVNNK